MKIDRIISGGFDILHYAYKQCNELHRMFPGGGFIDLMKHVYLNLEISDLCGSEVFYLKKFAHKVTILEMEIVNFVNQKENEDVYQKIEALLSTHNAIIHDDDINGKAAAVDMLPIGCMRYHVQAEFSGANITAITGGLMSEIFENEEGVFSEFYPGDLEINKILTKKFYHEFYRYMSNQMVDMDIITDFTLRTKFYQYCNSCNIARVYSPCGQMIFAGNNGQNLTHQLNAVKEAVSKNPYYLGNDTYVTLTLRTTFSTFMWFMLDTPYVIDHENLKLTLSQSDVFIADEIGNKYCNRIQNPILYLNDFRSELMKSSEIKLDKFNYILNGNMITYSLKLSLSDLETLVERSDFIYQNDVKETLTHLNSYFKSLKQIFIL